MSAVAGSLKYDTQLDASGFDKGLNKISSLSVAAGNLISSAIESATSAIIDLGKQSISAMADYEQLVGGIETLFGAKGAKSVQEYADIVGKSVDQVGEEYEKLKSVENTMFDYSRKAYKDAGISANSYMQQATSFSASLIKSLNGDTQKAAKITNMAIIDMSDNANKFGSDIESIQNAYQGFAKQNYTMLDNLKLGYGGTKEEMARLLMDATELSGIEYDIKNLNDVYEAIHVIQESLYISGTTAKEASSTISGSLNMVKASFEDVLSGSGTIDTLIDSIVILGENLIPAIEKMAPNLINGIVRLFEALIPKLPGIIQTLLPVVLDGIISLFNGIVQALPELITMILDLLPGIMEGIILLVQEIANQLPIIVTTISEMLPELIPILVDGILQIIPILLENLPLFIKAGYQLMIGLIEGLINSIPSLIEGLFNIRKHMKDFFKQMPQMFVEIGGNLIKGLWNGISNVTQWLFNKIKGFCSGVFRKIL